MSLPMTLPWLAALAALTLVRLLVAAWAPLSPDEAYYWVWSRALAPGFLDHPPMVALWMRAGTALLGPSALGVRLLGPVSAAAGTMLLAQAARDLLGADAPAPGAADVGVRAGALLNATLLLGVGAVVMTPDTPLLFFWTATLWALGRLLRTGRAGWWLVAGGTAGCALESKYTALLLGGALAVWLLAVPEGRRWLRRWQPWAGLGVAGVVLAPDLAWNAAHGWASLARQGGRTADWHPARAAGFLGELLGGQVGLATPGVFAVCAMGVWRAARRWREPGCALLACLVLVPAAVFVQHALGDRVQANWPAILYPAAAVAAAGLAPRLWRAAVALGLVLAAPVYLQAAVAPFALPLRLDVTLARMGGWDGLARAVSEHAVAGQAVAGPVVEEHAVAANRVAACGGGGDAAVARGQGDAFVAADEYGLAAQLAWHAAPGGLPVVGAEPRWALFALPAAPIGGCRGLLLRSVRRAGPPDPALWDDVRPLGEVVRARRGVTAEAYRLYRVTARAGLADAVTLPRPGER